MALRVARARSWSRVGSFLLDSDGSTQSFHIAGREWRITYTATQTSCEFTIIDCDAPALDIEKVSGYGSFDSVDLSRGTHTTAGTPDGPGTFRLTVRSYTGQWSVRLSVEQLA
jgi:hypothetical protein